VPYCIDCCVDISDITSNNTGDLSECVCVIGDVVIDLFGTTNLDFSFLKNLVNVTGIFSLENIELSNQTIEIPNLKYIGNNDNEDIALSVSSISGGDIIFPKLAVIKNGNAQFDINNFSGVYGFCGINWHRILRSGNLSKDSTCEGKKSSMHSHTTIVLSYQHTWYCVGDIHTT